MTSKTDVSGVCLTLCYGLLGRNVASFVSKLGIFF